MLVGRGRQEAYPPITALLKPVYKIARVSFLDPLYLPAPLAQLAEQVTLNHGRPEVKHTPLPNRLPVDLTPTIPFP